LQVNLAVVGTRPTGVTPVAVIDAWIQRKTMLGMYPQIRFLLLGSKDTQQAVGHLPGQTFASLFRNAPSASTNQAISQ
jgi:hypothetical protein